MLANARFPSWHCRMQDDDAYWDGPLVYVPGRERIRHVGFVTKTLVSADFEPRVVRIRMLDEKRAELEMDGVQVSSGCYYCWRRYIAHAVAVEAQHAQSCRVREHISSHMALLPHNQQRKSMLTRRTAASRPTSTTFATPPTAIRYPSD